MMARLVKLLVAIVLLVGGFALASPASASNCSIATAQGQTGPSSYLSYCWIDFSSYNATTATSTGGQNFSVTLQDGTVMAFNLKVSGTPVVAAAVPTWSGSSVGHSSFLGITGSPVLYQTGTGTTVSTLVFSNITLTPPNGGSLGSQYMFVAGDGESSNQNEGLTFLTNGGNWQLLDQSGPITGSTLPTLSGIGSQTVNISGAAGTVGAYIVGTTSPTSFTATLTTAGGLQGAMFAIRYASIQLNTVINGARAAPADQFSYAITSTASGTTLLSGTTTGTALSGFPLLQLDSAAQLPMTASVVMAAGSTWPMSHYQSSLSCTNLATGSTTVLPNKVLTTSNNFTSLQYNDNVVCTYTLTPYPHLTLTKALSANGRLNATDQFVMNITTGATTVATTTTTGTGTTVNTASTPQIQVTAGTTYTFAEAASGTTNLSKYAPSLACANADLSSTTTLPAAPGGTVKPAMGDIVACTFTNTLVTPTAALTILKTSTVLSDPINGSTNPKAIPGAIMQYSLLVTNDGTGLADSNSVFLYDKLPAQVAVGTASSPAFADGTPTSGLTMTAANVKYSNSATAPTSIARCTYTPASAYDTAVKYICFNPQGSMKGYTTASPNFTITFNAQLQ